jgi:hypothetical protein
MMYSAFIIREASIIYLVPGPFRQLFKSAERIKILGGDGAAQLSQAKGGGSTQPLVFECGPPFALHP